VSDGAIWRKTVASGDRSTKRNRKERVDGYRAHRTPNPQAFMVVSAGPCHRILTSRWVKALARSPSVLPRRYLHNMKKGPHLQAF
jgi:hypothetical protein